MTCIFTQTGYCFLSICVDRHLKTLAKVDIILKIYWKTYLFVRTGYRFSWTIWADKPLNCDQRKLTTCTCDVMSPICENTCLFTGIEDWFSFILVDRHLKQKTMIHEKIDSSSSSCSSSSYSSSSSSSSCSKTVAQLPAIKPQLMGQEGGAPENVPNLM